MVVGKDMPIDWETVAASFDPSGAFALPAKPEWVPAETYCSTVLVSSPAVPSISGEPSAKPGTSPNGVNGPNRFVYRATAGENDTPEAVVVNRVEITLYPTSVHDAFDPSGQAIGYFAPGVEFVTASEFPNAQAVAADARVKAAVRGMVDDCSSASKASCDDVMKAAIEAGDAALLGRPVGP